MAFEQTHIITSKNAEGKDVSFQLVQDGASFSSDTLPLYGYKLQFRLSRFGFGALNRTLTVTLLDTDDDFFLKLFTNQLRDDIRMNVIVDGKVFFTGFADYQQITAKRFVDNKKGVQIVFIDLFQALTKVNFNSPQIRDILISFNNSPRWTGDLTLKSFDQILREIIFVNYIDVFPSVTPEPDRLLYISDWVGENPVTQTRGNSTDGNERTSEVVYNYLWYDENKVVGTEYSPGLITSNTANTSLTLSGSTWSTAGVEVGTRIYDKRFRLIGTINTILNPTSATLTANALVSVSSERYFINIEAVDTVNVVDVMNKLSRSLWVRFGYSITYENIAIVQNDLGIYDSEYLPQCTMNPIISDTIGGETVRYRTTDVIPKQDFLSGRITANIASTTVTGVGTKFLTELAVNDKIYTRFGDLIGEVATITNDTSLSLSFVPPDNYEGFYLLAPDFGRRALPVIQKDDIILNSTYSIIDPYKSILYRLNGSPQFTRLSNADVSNNLNYEDYEAPGIFRPTGYLGKIAGNLIFLGGTFFKNSTGTEAFKRIDNASAFYHANWRFEQQTQYTFTVRKLLDPLIPHVTNFDDNAYIIVRGEYDLMRNTTIIQESITIYEVEE
jgi:hypothetical protein